MAKGRMIDKVIILSRKMKKVSEGAENLYYRVYINTDDYGHYHADSEVIKGQVYPLRNLSIEEIKSRILELAKVELIKLYNHNREEYLEIVDFEKHQKFRKDVARQAIYPSPVTFTKRPVTDTEQDDTERVPKLSKDKLREEKVNVRENVTVTKQEIEKLSLLFRKEKLEWMFDKLDYWATTKEKVVNGYGYFKKGSWLIEEMEKNFNITKASEENLENKKERDEYLAGITTEQAKKNERLFKNLAKGKFKKKGE